MHIFLFPSVGWAAEQRRVLAIEGKTPGSKPRDFFMVWAFLCLLLLEVYECWSPSDSSELPGYLDASLLPENLFTYIHIFFQPPSTI
jgi:hypothetical protein